MSGDAVYMGLNDAIGVLGQLRGVLRLIQDAEAFQLAEFDQDIAGAIRMMRDTVEAAHAKACLVI